MNADQLSLESIVKEVIADIIRRPAGEIDLANRLAKDLNICSDDLSMLFVPQLEARLHVKIPPREWLAVKTGWDACAVLRKHLGHAEDH